MHRVVSATAVTGGRLNYQTTAPHLTAGCSYIPLIWINNYSRRITPTAIKISVNFSNLN